MENKKIKIITLVSVILLISLLVLIAKITDDKKTESEQIYITRDEWINMLCEEMGIMDYKTEVEQYSDGDEFATGEFVVLSAMKVVCEDKMQIYLETNKEVTDEMYLETALELKVIKKDELKEYCSPVVAKEVVKSIKNMYYKELWPDDYEFVEYNDAVVKIANEDIVSYEADAEFLVVSKNMLDSISEGSIIVFEDTVTGLKCARKVVGTKTDGTIEVSDDIKLDEVLEKLVVSDVDELAFEDIVGFYGIENVSKDNESILTYGNSDDCIKTTKKFSSEIESKGYTINLVKGDDDDELVVEIVDNETDKSIEIDTNIEVNEENDCSVEIAIEEIYIGAQAKYTLLGGLEYVDVTVGAESTITGSIGLFDEEKIIPLFKTPAPLGNGIVGVDVEISLVIATDGSISFTAEIPVEASISYEKGKKIRKPSYDIDVDAPHFEGGCNASVSLQLEPTLVILSCINVMDVQAQMGITASAKVINQSAKQVCSDIEVAFPVLTLSVCGDEDSDTLLGELGISKEWEVISAEKAPKKLEMHFEMLSDGKIQKVDKCTYKEEETVEVMATEETNGITSTEEVTTIEEITTTEEMEGVTTIGQTAEIVITEQKEVESEEETTKVQVEEETTKNETSIDKKSKEEEDLKILYGIQKNIYNELANEAVYKDTWDMWSGNTEAKALSGILEGDSELGKALVKNMGAEVPTLVADCNKTANIYVSIDTTVMKVTVFCAESTTRTQIQCEELCDGNGNLVQMKVPNPIKFD